MPTRIEVLVPGSEQACCGAPIRIGDPAGYPMVALDPALDVAGTAGSAVPRFLSDRHGQAPADVPQREVSGLVAAITGVSYPSIPVAGQPGTRTADTAHPRLHTLSSLGSGDDAGLSDYLVLLDVPEDTELPHFVPSTERREQREREARTAGLREARSHDGLGVLLRALADDAERRFGALARILRSEDAAAVTIEPQRTAAAALHWMRSAEEGADGIRVQLGDGVWNLPADQEQAELLREFLDAAADGRVEEQLLPGDDGPGPMRTVVTAADGRSWTATTDRLTRFGAGAVFAMAGPLARRLERGDHRYAPWG